MGIMDRLFGKRKTSSSILAKADAAAQPAPNVSHNDEESNLSN